MTKLRDILVCVLLAASICACCALTWALAGARDDADQLRETLVSADAAIADLRTHEFKLYERVNAEDGILDRIADEQAQIRDVTRSARISVDEVGQASIEQRHYLENELPILTADVAGTLGELRTSIAAARPVEADAAQVVRDLDARVTSPQVTRILDSGAAAADHSAEAAANVDQVTAEAADTAHQLHGLLHWKWPGRIAHSIRKLF